MPPMSKKIRLLNKEKLANVNPETLKLYKKYLIDMNIRELSQGTINGYYNDLANWWMYIYDFQDNKSVLEIDEDDIVDFIYFCKSSGNNTERIKRRMSSISGFYIFLRKKKLITDNPMEFMDRPKRGQSVITQVFLTSNQVDVMRKVLQENVEKNRNNIVDYHSALVLQLYAEFSLITMARVNAVAHIKWEQIDLDNRIAENVLEKEGYLVDLFFNENVAVWLKQLKDFRLSNQIDDGGYVFIATNNKKGEAISTSTLNKYCKTIGQMIGEPTLHPHDFRHSGATLYIEAGMSLEEVSSLLNHKSTDVTRKFYIKDNKSKLKAHKDSCQI